MLGRVLVLSASAGAGHLRAADAIEKAIRLRGLASEVEHVDVLGYTNKVFRHLYSKAYIDLVNKAPELLGWLYDHLDDPRKNDPLRLAFDRLNANPFIRYLRRYQPDVAVCTHFLPSEIISSLKGEEKVEFLNTVVVTDFDVHAMWLCRHVEQYFVALEETKVHLSALGVADSLITVSGIPIDPVFAEAKDKRAMRKKHGLDQVRFTILVSAGGFGVGPIGHLVQALARLSHRAQVVAVCGRNEALRAELAGAIKSLAERSVVSFRLLGFTNEMDELMSAADLYVGKPGGLTTSEALAKGLPMVVINPIPGQEERNSDHLLEDGAGIRCNNLPTLAYKIDTLIDTPGKLAQMRENARSMGRPHAAFTVVDRLMLLCEARASSAGEMARIQQLTDNKQPRRMVMRTMGRCIGLCLILGSIPPLASAQDHPAAALSDYFPVQEEQGGWRTLLPAEGTPDDSQKARIREAGGMDWDALKVAWDYNASAAGATGLLVIRRGYVVGEWYKEANQTTAFNIYSSSKSYTSTAFGLILSDFGNSPLPGKKVLSLDTKVCNAEWIPESLPLPDPRKAEITVRHLLNMASGLDVQNPPVQDHPFEWSLGHVSGSPMAKLKNDPGAAFHYSNAGVAHLVILFHRATGEDLFPFLKRRLFEPIGETQVRWTQMGGKTAIGPLSQGYSGIFTNPRQHARFCYLALHRGAWAGNRLVPASYYDFAWKGTLVKPDYGGQWWTQPHIPGAPSDLVMTLGRNHNDGFVIPSLDLVFVRLGDGSIFPKDFEKTLVLKVLTAVVK